jgi:serine/threonine-protein kinase
LLQRRADGSAPAETVLEASRPIAYGFVTPDGEWVIYQTEIDGPTRRDLFARRLRGDTTTMVIAASPADEMAPRLSPDGHWLAYVSDESGPPTVYVSPFPNTTASRVQVSVGGGAEPFWSRNGRELFYTAFGTPWDLMVARVETSPTFRVLDRTLLFSRAAYNRSIPDAPFYDVSLATLDDVIAFYDRGGGPSRYLDPEIRPLKLTAAERRDLRALLGALTSRR